MATRPSTDFFADCGAVFAFSNNTVEGTPASGAPELIVAGAAGDATAITGNTINRQTYNMPQSCLLAVTYYANIADGETLSLAVEIQESSDGTTWDTAEAIQASTAVESPSGSAFTDGDVKTYRVYLGDRKQYIRFNCTPDFSASATDTGVVQGIALLAGSWDPSGLPAHQEDDSFYG